MRCGEQVQLPLVNGAAETCNTCHRLQAAHCTLHSSTSLLPLAACNLLPATTSTASIFSCCAQITHSKIEPDPMREMRNASSRFPLCLLLPLPPPSLLHLSCTASQWPMKATSDPAETVVSAERHFGVVEEPTSASSR